MEGCMAPASSSQYLTIHARTNQLLKRKDSGDWFFNHALEVF
jgi:hypothetical protein